jgi:membrane-associated protease RseP (regulator of RpoE activity)
MTLGRGVLITAGILALALAALAHAGTKAPRPPQPAKAPAAPTPEAHKKVIIFRSGGSWLGVQIADVDADRAREIGMREEAGAEIQAVTPDSPAEEAGLEKGDVILDYQGTRIEGVAQLTRLVRETPAGRTATLKVFRDGSTRTFQVKVGERGDREAPDADRHIQIFRGDGDGEGRWIQIPDVPDVQEIPNFDMEMFGDSDMPGLLSLHGVRGRPRLGAVVDDVGPQLAEFFGLKQEGGVLVKSVKKGSPGDNAGLKAGDVIVRVDDESVEDISDLSLALSTRRDKEVRLTVVRDRREQTITVPPAPASESTPRGHRRSGSPAALEKDLHRQYERALREAAAVRAEAMVEATRAREAAQQAVEESRRAIEEALRDAAEAAHEAEIDEEEIDDDAADREDVDVPARRAPIEVTPVSDDDRDAIRRAVEEARRIRIGMQTEAVD